MHEVCGYAVWPCPCQVTTVELPSMLASLAVFAYGVAGSLTVPTTTIGGAPTALPVGNGSRLAGHAAQGRIPVPSDPPNSGYFARQSSCFCRASAVVSPLASSSQEIVLNASNMLL